MPALHRPGPPPAPRPAPVRISPDLPPPPPRARHSNNRPVWDAPTRCHLGNGRAGGLTPGQARRARQVEVR
ncbi:hypothetical protein [Plantactinospora sp. B6F1]|uniref:hypothetical protein n=1 Tax=Plantactinospora sp. B6F1 TaxID=3158971 RepID=UPI0032D8D9AC